MAREESGGTTSGGGGHGHGHGPCHGLSCHFLPYYFLCWICFVTTSEHVAICRWIHLPKGREMAGRKIWLKKDMAGEVEAAWGRKIRREERYGGKKDTAVRKNGGKSSAVLSRLFYP